MISFSFPPTVWVLRKRKKREENSYLGLLAFTEARKVLGFCSQDPETALLVLNPNITFLTFLVKEKNKKNEKSSSPNVTTNHLTPEFLSYLFVFCFLCFLSNHTTRKPLYANLLGGFIVLSSCCDFYRFPCFPGSCLRILRRKLVHTNS